MRWVGLRQIWTQQGPQKVKNVSVASPYKNPKIIYIILQFADSIYYSVYFFRLQHIFNWTEIAQLEDQRFFLRWFTNVELVIDTNKQA